MSGIITSRQNGLIKQLNSLHTRSGREKAGMFLLEGVRVVEEALDAGLILEYALYSEQLVRNHRGEELLARLTHGGIHLQQVEDHLLCEVAGTERPQGLAVAARFPKPDWPTEYGQLSSLRLLVIDGIQDPGNLGTIIRTADAFSVHAVICLKGTVDPYNAKVVRSAMGSLFHLPVIVDQVGQDVIERLHAAGVQIIATAVDQAVNYRLAAYSDRVALVMGNEGAGVSDLWMQAADLRVTIPISGQSESLNVAVAAGILLAELSA